MLPEDERRVVKTYKIPFVGMMPNFDLIVSLLKDSYKIDMTIEDPMLTDGFLATMVEGDTLNPSTISGELNINLFKDVVIDESQFKTMIETQCCVWICKFCQQEFLTNDLQAIHQQKCVIEHWKTATSLEEKINILGKLQGLE